MNHSLKLDAIICGIIMTRGESGATISEIRSDYFDIVCQHWPLRWNTTDQIVQYLMEINGIVAERIEDGPYVWYVGGECPNSTDCEMDEIGNHTPSVTMKTEPENIDSIPNNSLGFWPAKTSSFATTSSTPKEDSTTVSESMGNSVTMQSGTSYDENMQLEE